MKRDNDPGLRQHLHRGHAAGGGRPGGRLRPVPLRGRATRFHATFTEASRLKAGQDVRIAGVPVGSVKGVELNPDNTVDVAFDVNDRYQLYTSTRAVVRYQNLVGDRYLEITSGPGDLRKLPAGATIAKDEHPARAGPRRPARRTAPGAQGPRRQQGQRGQQRRHRAAAGPGRFAVDPARQHVVVHPGPRRPRPADRRHASTT